MSQDQSSNKRIAKNTVMLYIRMFITLLIGLYTSRVILNALGVTDYGVYNVVGGFVGLFGLVSASMSGSISRFITFELGRGSIEKLRLVFSTASIVQIAIAGIVLLLAETVGLWYLYNKMVIPEDRMFAAQIVFQLSVVSFVLGLIYVPYNAAIIAHEEMGKFAMFSIVESVAKLVIALVVRYAAVDKLILYASLGCMVSWAMCLGYIYYCKRHFEECTFRYRFDKTLFSQIFSFAGWNAIGTSAAILRSQGANLLLNLFGGPAVNAAAGVATTLTGVVGGFVSNFTTAYNPQITKSYASANYERLHGLLYTFSRLSYYMMFFFALPVFLNARFILTLWLGTVPEHTVAFVRLVILFMLTEVISQPLITAKNATGRIRNYQIVVGGVLLIALPLSYVFLIMGAPVESVYVANLISVILAFLARIWMLRGDLPNWSSRTFLFSVGFRIVIVSVAASLLPVLSYIVLDDSWIRLIVTSLISVVTVIVSSYFLGLNTKERHLAVSFIQKKIHR